jgi:dipeptidyl aminopeptidase/acylaminoacyl peptidase
MIKFFHVLLFTFFFTIVGNSQSVKFSYDHILDMVQASNPELSEDGNWGLYTLVRTDIQVNRKISELFFVDIKNNQHNSLGESRRLQVKWIPESKKISYLSSIDGKRQVFEMSRKGENIKQITNSPYSIDKYLWSPNGKELALIVSDPKSERENKFNDVVVLGNNDYLVDETPTGKSIFVYNMDKEDFKKISPDGWTVGTGLSTSGLFWNADGSQLAYTVFPSAYSGDSDKGKIYITDINTGETKGLTSNEGMESPVAFSKDSHSIYFRYKRNGNPSDMSDIFVYDRLADEIKNMTSSLDQTVNKLKELDDGSSILTGFGRDRSKFWKVEKGGQYSEMDLGKLINVRSSSFTSDGSCLMVAEEAGKGQQVYLREAKGRIKQLTMLNLFLEEVAIGKQESISWESSDGLTPNGIVTYPPDFDPSRKYPLILQIHGGPTASSRLGFNNTAQLMAAKGWIVFQPNYRGSNNLGNEFQSAIANDPSEGPGNDVITGVRFLKEKSYIDSSKIAVSGWSYGGWMTAWLIGRYPDEWKAAIAGAAPVDFTDMYSLNDLNRMRRHSITRSPYVGDNLQWAYDNSPITNFSKIKVPTLILSKIGDSRVTITGSYKLYGALRDNGVAVEFIGYPGPGHFPSDPVRSKDVWDRWIAWIEKYLEDKV